mgnify:FL=1
MRRQQGIATGWLYLIGLIVVLALVSSILYGVTGYLKEIDLKGYDRGKQETLAAIERRDNEALAKALARVKQLADEIRGLEQGHAETLAGVSKRHLKEKADAKRRSERDLAAARSGALKLRDPARAVACPPASSGSQGAAPGAAAGGRDGEAGSELSGAAAEFLLGLANEADDAVRQLAACQAVIKADRAISNR